MHFESFWYINHDWTHFDTIFNMFTFPFIAPHNLLLPGQPAKFLLVPSSFWAFLASSSLLATRFDMACCHTCAPWIIGVWGSWWRECRWHFRVVAIATTTCSNALCDIGRLQGSSAQRMMRWASCWELMKHERDQKPCQASKRHGRFDEEIQTVGYWELSSVNTSRQLIMHHNSVLSHNLPPATS